VGQIEELKTTPNETTKASAPELAAQALDQELKSTTPSAPLPVNDLTGMVKKKKKDQTSTPDSTGSSKRKAEDEAVPETAKRTKSEGVDEPAN
jgi:HAT1-interacting factor 1